MVQRLRMTNADYVAIAVSPALVMALVGSLVFFLIEVLYVGDYGVRLNYVFALFVFATVLIARISIEMGSERAAMFSLPLGLVTFLALQRFVEHQSSFSWLINLTLLGVVWWCAHKLTWDSTVIDDNEDSSGEGLLGRVGLDGRDEVAADGAADNELLAAEASAAARPWWRRLGQTPSGPHTPGLWVFYFSLAALPLFGIGQRWIPADEVGRRRYAFGLLAVYVAAALSLLVTTSFLGLRRYLRQRRVEMPAPMSVTWVALGAALILLVMFAAALVPRPKAEYALARVPWQAGSPGGQGTTRYSVGKEGAVDPEAREGVISERADAPRGDSQQSQQDSNEASEQSGGTAEASSAGSDGSRQTAEGSQSSSPDDQAASGDAGQPNEPANQQQADREAGDASRGQPSQAERGDQQQGPRDGETANRDEETTSSGGNSENETNGAVDNTAARGLLDHAAATPSAPQLVSTHATSLATGLKLLFYAILALAIGMFAWRHRAALLQAAADLLRELRAFFARLLGGRTAPVEAEAETAALGPRRRTFGEFTDPFATGRDRQLPPVELVRYTFEAFEAWAGDRGQPRTPDQTPQELVHRALAPQTPMYAEARQMAQLYGQAAYASASISREAASKLSSLWHMMRTDPPRRPPTP
jgi:hypothetical protein